MRCRLSRSSVYVARQGSVVRRVVYYIYHVNGSVLHALFRTCVVGLRYLGRSYGRYRASFYYVCYIRCRFFIFLRIFVVDGQGSLRHYRGEDRYSMGSSDLAASGLHGVQVLLL